MPSPFDKLLELGLHGERAAPAKPSSKGKAPARIKAAKPAKKKKPKPKAASKRRKGGITLERINGVLVALTPADVRRRAKQTLATKRAPATPTAASLTMTSSPSPTAVEGKRKAAKGKPILPAVAVDPNLAVQRMIDALPDRSMAELRQQWLNVMEMLAARPRKGLVKFRDAVMAEWDRRYRFALEDPDFFEWPRTVSHGGDGSLNHDNWHEQGMLSYLGYHVGVTRGLSEGVRREILKGVFRGSLPPLNGPDYVQQWGGRSTAVRLKKMADVLASLAKNAKAQTAYDKGSAIADWEADLQFLYHEYYVGKFGFDWPSLVR